MKFTVLIDPALVIITLYLVCVNHDRSREECFWKKYINFSILPPNYFPIMQGVHKIYNSLFLYPIYANPKPIFFRLTKRSIIRRLNNDSIFYFISMPVEFAVTICFNVNGIFCRRIYCRPNNLEKKYRYRYILTPAKIYALGRQYVPRVPAWFVAGDNMCRDDNICRHGLNFIRISKGFTNTDDSTVSMIWIIWTQSN